MTINVQLVSSGLFHHLPPGEVVDVVLHCSVGGCGVVHEEQMER